MGPASAFGQGAVPSAVIDVRDFGAKGDGRTDDADAIAKAIQTGIAKGQGAGFGFTVAAWLGVVLLVMGLFVAFEAARGWCVLRACGIKTKF